MTPALSDLTPEQALKHLELLFIRHSHGLHQGDHCSLSSSP